MKFSYHLDQTVNLELVTSAGSKEEKISLSEKFDELKMNFADYNVIFSYSFEKMMHDRWIESDTGWKIHLSRGLDLYQKPDSELALGVC